MTDYPVNMHIKTEVEAFFDEPTNTISYIVKDPSSDACAIIDSVMDLDYAAGRITHDSADRMIARIKERGLKLEWIIETHVHADHLSAAPYLQQELGGKIGVGEGIMIIQETFGKIFNEGTEFQRDGSQFDALFKDGDTYIAGLGHVHARPYTCLYGSRHWQRDLHGRYVIHARWWVRARGFSRRGCWRSV
jgi:glyoxylase-like metal-dependent hydrolase (beta-lactamase superfamily II)